MFILPALLYLKVLPLFGQCLYHFIVPNKSRHPHAGGESPLWSSPGLTPLLGGPRQCGYFCTTPAGGHLVPTDLTCTRPAYTAVLRWNRVSDLEPSGTEVEKLPPGHHGLKINLE
ncbi:hypothetical protein AVEN_225303-1 [Araneus ventricosus]|uniref:Secreted protein n=1 Tax=Araneus ventricosus TaxID=182803 RepID=A0A4Y2ALE0_ARAVE|nr:hypothetical protein AVEN_225303-1 [Araneus ventricosus]